MKMRSLRKFHQNRIHLRILMKMIVELELKIKRSEWRIEEISSIFHYAPSVVQLFTEAANALADEKETMVLSAEPVNRISAD